VVETVATVGRKRAADVTEKACVVLVCRRTIFRIELSSRLMRAVFDAHRLCALRDDERHVARAEITLRPPLVRMAVEPGSRAQVLVRRRIVFVVVGRARSTPESEERAKNDG